MLEGHVTKMLTVKQYKVKSLFVAEIVGVRGMGICKEGGWQLSFILPMFRINILENVVEFYMVSCDNIYNALIF